MEDNVTYECQVHGDIFDVFNICLLIAKYYNYKYRLFEENNMEVYQYLINLTDNLTMELLIFVHNTTPLLL